jgi:hypothetical protein
MLSVMYAKCHKLYIMLSVIMPNVIMLSIVAPSTLLCLVISEEDKSLIILTLGLSLIKLFLFVIDTLVK